MVTVALFYALLLVGAIVVGALVAAPLRKGSPKLFIGIVLSLPVLLLALYQVVGKPLMLDREAVAAASSPNPQSIEQAIVELREELKRNPAQPEGWRLLGRTYASMGRHAESRDAFATALRHAPDDPDLLVEAAQANAQASPDHRFDDAAFAMLRKAMTLDPENQRAQWFIGVVQRQRGLDADAVATWEALLPRLDPETAAALRSQIDVAREAAGMAPLPAATQATPVATGRGLRVRVALDPDFASRVRLRGDATVFVIARRPDGPPMPVAVERHALQDLPLDIVLDDGDSPMPTAKLSALQDVEVLARLSASGSANRGEGDLESAPVRVTLPADAPVELVLGKATP